MNKSFEDFPVYQKTLQTIKAIEVICNYNKQNQFIFIKDQIRRASSSILLNLAEGSVKWSKKDKINFYRMSCASAAECMAAIDLFASYKMIEQQKAEEIKKALREIIASMQALIISIQNRPQ
jgi:four helix bundle protein